MSGVWPLKHLNFLPLPRTRLSLNVIQTEPCESLAEFVLNSRIWKLLGFIQRIRWFQIYFMKSLVLALVSRTRIQRGTIAIATRSAYSTSSAFMILVCTLLCTTVNDLILTRLRCISKPNSRHNSQTRLSTGSTANHGLCQFDPEATGAKQDAGLLDFVCSGRYDRFR